MSDQGPVVLNGRYELHRRIARGGMADVVLARDQLLERPVAVKILFPEYASDQLFVERFRREAQAAANLNHPNIVGVYDWGRESGTYFIVMEYVDGRSLADILRSEGTLHPQRAADVATDVAAALGFAHRNGVVHRDIKPGNVLISSSGVVKVTDFGIARAISTSAEDNLTQAGSVMGTATYFSPEQAQGKAVDPRSDLYSLGVVMYEMVCGKPPFQADSPVAVAYKHVQEHAELPRAVNPEVPAAYESVTMKLLAKNPANRYPSAEDLRADLRRFREGQPVLAESGPHEAEVAATAAVAAVGAGTPGHTPPGGTPAYGYDEYDDYDDAAQPRRTGWFILALVLLLAVLAGIIFLFYKGLGAGGSDTVTIPDVHGESGVTARSTLIGKGFAVTIVSQPSATVPANIVIGTKPPAGTKAAKGSEVRVLVSSGPNGSPMPSLAGLTPDQAITQLEDLRPGWDASLVSQTTRETDSVDKGLIISSTPGKGQPFNDTTRVTFVVSAGPSSRVPSGLEGFSVNHATKILTDAGYTVSTTYVYSDTVAQGKVAGTDPPGGSQLKPGSNVAIQISNGPQPTTTIPPSTLSPTTVPPTTAPPTTAPPTTAGTTTTAN
jgi:serine/threonine-protein kinase